MAIARYLASGLAVAVLSTAPATAQQQPAGDQQTGAQAENECVAGLRDFNQRAMESGYGMAGPRGYGVRAPVGGWGVTQGPRREMRALYAAAEVFARRGNTEACQFVLGEMEQLYQERMQQIQEADMQPEEVRDWRHQRLLAAEPVTETERVLRAETVLGADLRNPKDEDLGDIENVLLDPNTGKISYVLVERGGFLDVGGERYAVRWQDLQVAPDIDTFVLKVSERVAENAPTLGDEQFANLQREGDLRQNIEQFWDQHFEG